MKPSLLRYWRSRRGALAVRLKILLIRLQEARTFFRFPRHIKVDANGNGRVILYGIPYADWNATLSDRRLWSNLPGIVQVLRLPATPFGSAARAGDVVVAVKTGHVARPAGGRALEPTARAIATLEDKAKFAAYMAANGFADHCPLSLPAATRRSFPAC